MMSHFSRLKEELDSKQHELQEQQAAIEAQKEALATLESAINTAMHTKSGTQDVFKHVTERAMRSDHTTASELVQTTLTTAMQINGRSRHDNLEDLFDEILTDNASIEAAIDSSMENSEDVNDVVKYALATALDGALDAKVKKSIINTVITVIDHKAFMTEPMKKAEAPLKENTPHVRLPTVTLPSTNGLRGQAADFKPATDSKQSYNPGGWQALARDNWGSNGGGGG